jgi:hypothetical protein
MLLCRHLLRRVHIPIHSSGVFSNIARSTQNVTLVRFTSTLPSFGLSKTSTRPDFSIKNLSNWPVEHVLQILLQVPKHLPPSQSRTVGSAEGYVKGNPGDLVAVYEFLRERDRSLLNDLPVSAYTRVIKDAFIIRSSTCLDHLARDILEIYQGNAYNRTVIVQAILSLVTDISLISRYHVFSLLSQLESLDQLPLLSPKVLARATMVALAHSDEPLLRLVAPSYVKIIYSAPTLSGANSMAYHPSHFIRASFILTCWLLNEDKHQALKLFQALVDTRNIPTESISEANALPQDFAFIIRSTIIKSCLHWNWKDNALELLIDLMTSTRRPDASVVHVAADVMYALLREPSIEDLKDCNYLIRMIHQWHDSSVPNALVRQLYDTARELDLGKQAESLFAHIHSPAVSPREYPIPRGRALTWLMEYLAVQSGNKHLARILAQKVAESRESIPIQDRARFIAIAATSGYSTQARAIWERYASGKEKNEVVGNAAMMLRLVSLFTKLVKKTDEKCKKLFTSTGVVTSNTINTKSYNDYQDRISDLTEFADRVVSAFRQSKGSISKAAHFDLTSLARSYFILGQVSAGFQTLRVLIDRKELPDLYDINVALSMLAKRDPRKAADIIERMVKKGYNPDPVTFDTVLHHTVLHGDVHQIDAFISRARELGHRRITPKTISSLLLRSLEIKDTTPVLLKANVGRVLNIIRSTVHSAFIHTPNIGKAGIFAAVHADDPMTAYAFWKFLVRARTEWEDDEQDFQRQLIANLIRKHARAGFLIRRRARIMLSDLGKGGQL